MTASIKDVSQACDALWFNGPQYKQMSNEKMHVEICPKL